MQESYSQRSGRSQFQTIKGKKSNSFMNGTISAGCVQVKKIQSVCVILMGKNVTIRNASFFQICVKFTNNINRKLKSP